MTFRIISKFAYLALPRIATLVVVCAWMKSAVAQNVEPLATQQGVGAGLAASLPLNRIVNIFHLPRDTDALSVPVEIEGVVILAVTETASFFFHDGEMGVHVSQPGGTKFKTGDRVKVVGDTRRGRYAPSVIPRKIVLMGEGDLPEPRAVAVSQVVSGSMDSQWVEVVGVVSAVTFSPDKRYLMLDLARDGGRLRTVVGSPFPTQTERLLDAEVRVRGVATGRFNRQGQMVEPLIRVAGSSWVSVIRPGPDDPFALPKRSISRLLEFSLDRQPQHRVKVQGVVTRRFSDTIFFLRDERHGLKVEARNLETLQAGDQIEAVGFPVIVNDEVVIQNAMHRKIATGVPPAAVRSELPALLNGSRASDLVCIEARLVDWVADGQNLTLVLETHKHLFRGLLRQAAGAAWTAPEKGSILDVTGICAISELKDLWYYQPHSFALLIAAPEDVRVLQAPPWWTAERLWRALVVALGLLAAGAAWVWALQRQVQRKRSVIEFQASHAAVLEERSRIARDLHDTLEQGLTGLSLQLKAIETDLTCTPHPVVSRLALARQMLRQSRALARNAIRELRVETLPSRQESFVKSLQDAAEMWNHSGALTVVVRIEGEPRPLPGKSEHNLAGIGTEAMTNAVKHGRATAVQIDISFSADLVTLTITDNGGGFNPATVPAGDCGCFGLVGMRERALEMAARIEIQSEPGRGTVILVEVPPVAEGVHPPLRENAAQTAASPPPAIQPVTEPS